MEATKELSLIAETVDADAVEKEASAIRELASLELGLVGGGSAAVCFM